MAKKFFYNRVYNTKKNITTAIIIGGCIIGVIICFIFVSSFSGENHSGNNASVSIKSEATIEINQQFEKDIFFSKMDNITVDDIKIEYGLDYDISKVGRYDVKITIAKKEYASVLNVIDTTKPELILKDVEIKVDEDYTADDFVDSCSDNSKNDCIIYFSEDGITEDGESIDYSKFTEPGEYEIKISAEDESGNLITKDVKLTIKDKNDEPDDNPSQGEDDKPIVCKYGNNEYDTESYLIAVDITNKDCAISLDLYKEDTMTVGINKLMDSETTRIKKDVEALNLTGTLTMNRKVTAVINKTGNGIVGYELRLSVGITHNGETKTVVDYKVDKDGKRVFIENPHNLSE